MLLDLGTDEILALVKTPANFEKQVTQFITTLKEYVIEKKRDELGALLYARVCETHQPRGRGL